MQLSFFCDEFPPFWKHKKDHQHRHLYIFKMMNSTMNSKICSENVATLLWESVRMKLTLPKWGLGSPSGLSKVYSSIARVKTPHIGAFFISLEKYRSVDVENGLSWAIWTSEALVMVKRKAESNWQFDSQPLKVGNRPDLDACKWSGTHRWKALDKSYNFASDLVPIWGLSKEL
jgi:hypothetical protein